MRHGRQHGLRGAVTSNLTPFGNGNPCHERPRSRGGPDSSSRRISSTRGPIFSDTLLQGYGQKPQRQPRRRRELWYRRVATLLWSSTKTRTTTAIWLCFGTPTEMIVFYFFCSLLVFKCVAKYDLHIVVFSKCLYVFGAPASGAFFLYLTNVKPNTLNY